MQPLSLKYAKGLLEFINASPTPFHAVKAAQELLSKAGFTKIREKDDWAAQIKPNGKYFLTRNASTIVAFAVGGAWKPGNALTMLAAHTDSPCLRLKPVSKKSSDGYLQVGVETYGGGIWHSWFDRDLSLAGRAMVKADNGHVYMKLVNVKKPILRIPTLAIHLDRTQTFDFNKETQLLPIAGLVAAELHRAGKPPSSIPGPSETPEPTPNFAPLPPCTERHHSYILDLVAESANCDPERIVDFELSLYDTQMGVLGGINQEFVFAARQDNLVMVYSTITALINSLKCPADSHQAQSDNQNQDHNQEFELVAVDSHSRPSTHEPSSPSPQPSPFTPLSLAQDSTIRLVACFDHEEIGSRSAQGADSSMLPSIVRRLSLLPAESQHPNSVSTTAFEQSLAKSFLISADQAHAVHPNYAAKYESSHRPKMNKGLVIKVNANSRYATSSPGIALCQEIARLARRADTYAYSSDKVKSGVPLQLFVVRNDSSCGSTVGPMLSSLLGTRTVDVGNPQLSMHSIRETGGSYDVEHAINFFHSYFNQYAHLSKSIIVD